MHRVEIRNIEKIEIKLGENVELYDPEKRGNNQENFLVEEPNNADLNQDDFQKTSNKKKEGDSSLTKEIIAILESKRNQVHKKIIEEDSNYFLVAHIKKITEPDFEVNISLETKLKHLIDIYSKILYMNKGQIPLVNYNLQDANRIVDSMGGVISAMGYFKKKELQEVFEIIEINERLNNVHNLAAKYLSFLQNFSDVGV